MPTDLKQQDVIQPFQIVAEDIFVWSVEPKRWVNLPFHCAFEILLPTYVLRLRLMKWMRVAESCRLQSVNWRLSGVTAKAYVTRNARISGGKSVQFLAVWGTAGKRACLKRHVAVSTSVRRLKRMRLSAFYTGSSQSATNMNKFLASTTIASTCAVRSELVTYSHCSIVRLPL